MRKAELEKQVNQFLDELATDHYSDMKKIKQAAQKLQDQINGDVVADNDEPAVTVSGDDIVTSFERINKEAKDSLL